VRLAREPARFLTERFLAERFPVTLAAVLADFFLVDRVAFLVPAFLVDFFLVDFFAVFGAAFLVAVLVLVDRALVLPAAFVVAIGSGSSVRKRLIDCSTSPSGALGEGWSLVIHYRRSRPVNGHLRERRFLRAKRRHSPTISARDEQCKALTARVMHHSTARIETVFPQTRQEEFRKSEDALINFVGNRRAGL
jgi:hypothetical protein